VQVQQRLRLQRHHEPNGAPSDELSTIDLGLPTDPGGKTFQFASGNGRDGYAGICVYTNPAAMQLLHAAGNIFPTANCASSAANLVHMPNACPGSADCGIVGANSTNTIDLTKCM
jgi:hypothetical protein